MQELIVALTRAANAVACYYEKSAGATLASLAPTHEVALAAEVPPAETLAVQGIPPLPKKSSAKKAKAPAPETTPTLGAPAAAAKAAVAAAAVASAAAVSPAPAAPAYTPEQERESTTELYKTAAAYIQKTPEPDAMEARRTHGMAKMQELFKVETIKDLSHPQRLGFIQWLKAETAKA